MISTKYSPIVTCDHKYSDVKYSNCLFWKNSGAAGAKNCLFGTPKLKNMGVAYFPPLPLHHIGILIPAFFGSDFCRGVPSELLPWCSLDNAFEQVHEIEKMSWNGLKRLILHF
jgi:hypothetical protein